MEFLHEGISVKIREGFPSSLELYIQVLDL